MPDSVSAEPKFPPGGDCVFEPNMCDRKANSSRVALLTGASYWKHALHAAVGVSFMSWCFMSSIFTWPMQDIDRHEDRPKHGAGTPVWRRLGEDAAAPPRICDPGGQGTLLPLFDFEKDMAKPLRAAISLIVLLWFFIGVNVIADVFMDAIEAITSKRKVRKVHGRTVIMKAWHPTVANLSLMALGSSAPEILLAVIEIVGADFHAGQLGPSTIVGSAAFNLFVIIAICISIVPPHETRTIEFANPFIVTTLFSLFAYVWMVIVLAVISPNLVEWWEGLLTFIFFPVLVVASYAADVGTSKSSQSPHDVESNIEDAKQGLSDLRLLQQTAKAKGTPSIAVWRMQAGMMSWMKRQQDTKKDLVVGLASTKYVFDKSESKGVVHVFKSGILTSKDNLRIHYTLRLVSEDAVAKESVDEFVPRRHTACVRRSSTSSTASLALDPKTTPEGKLLSTSSVLMESDDYEAEITIDEAMFEWCTPGSCLQVELLRADPETNPGLSVNGSQYVPRQVPIIGGQNLAVVLRRGLNVAAAGELEFEKTLLQLDAPTETMVVRVKVVRKGCTATELACEYRTEEDTARYFYDFEQSAGTLVFKAGMMEQTILVTILKKERWASHDRFYVVIDGPSVKQESVCAVTVGDAKTSSQMMVAAKCMDRICNVDAIRQSVVEWKKQFWASLSVIDDDDEDAEDIGEEDGPSISDWVMHVISLPWKVLFVVVPPSCLCGGWLRFVISLIFIGMVTAVIGDLASLAGCCADVPDAITAITIVALGTSLPDTFASMLAAVGDPHADMAIGNVTGSNAVNVFLGLGLPWMLAGMHWHSNGATPEWIARYPAYHKDYPNGGFVVPAGDLAFSVAIFILFATSAIGVIWFRRKKYSAELGGPRLPAIHASILFFLFWIFYICLASWKVLSGEVEAVTMFLVLFFAFVALAGCFAVMSSFVHAHMWYHKRRQAPHCAVHAKVHTATEQDLAMERMRFHSQDLVAETSPYSAEPQVSNTPSETDVGPKKVVSKVGEASDHAVPDVVALVVGQQVENVGNEATEGFETSKLGNDAVVHDAVAQNTLPEADKTGSRSSLDASRSGRNTRNSTTKKPKTLVKRRQGKKEQNASDSKSVAPLEVSKEGSASGQKRSKNNLGNSDNDSKKSFDPEPNADQNSSADT